MDENGISVQIKGDTKQLNAALEKANADLEKFGNTANDVSNYVNSWTVSASKYSMILHGIKNAWGMLAGEVGVHPGEFSLRQLFQMAEGKRRQEWYRAAVLACTISNPWRDPAHSLKMEHFPYCQEHKAKVRMATSAEIAAFAKAWK